MNGMKSYLSAASIALVLCLFMGCGENGCKPEATPEQLTREGWDRFEDNQYQGALLKFDQALGRDPGHGEAYNGVGWCCANLDSLEAGIDAFDHAISHGVITADPRAGKAVIYRDLEPVDFQTAIGWADSALAIDSDYVFSHDTSLDWKDLRLILAHSYYGLSQYDEAKAQVDILNPGNTLDPGSDTYVEDLLAEIQRLGDEI
ncbi:MAG: tetratricopeptide repeat protein [Candidatus Eisenbacteria bacterium]